MAVSAPFLILSLDEVLAQGETLLAGISDAAYVEKIPAAFHASIGAHYRHSVEHIQTMLEAQAGGELDYDTRPRHQRLETERAFAREMTRGLRQQVSSLNQAALTRPLSVRCKTSYGSTDSAVAASVLEREIMFVISHAIHHYAQIRLMCGLQNIPLPPGFGVAPSTLQHKSQSGS